MGIDFRLIGLYQLIRKEFENGLSIEEIAAKYQTSTDHIEFILQPSDRPSEQEI